MGMTDCFLLSVEILRFFLDSNSVAAGTTPSSTIAAAISIFLANYLASFIRVLSIIHRSEISPFDGPMRPELHLEVIVFYFIEFLTMLVSSRKRRSVNEKKQFNLEKYCVK
jgi:hypothetical protein